MDLMLKVAGICGGIVTILGFLSLILKGPKTLVKKMVTEYGNELIKEQIEKNDEMMRKQFDSIKELLQEINEEQTKNKEALLASLRHSITKIYVKYRGEKLLSERSKQDLCSLYATYESLGGNSYVHEIYDDMMKWDVK